MTPGGLAELYPEPALVGVIAVTAPPDKVIWAASTVAASSPVSGSSITTVGSVDPSPLPPDTTVNPEIAPEPLTVAVTKTVPLAKWSVGKAGTVLPSMSSSVANVTTPVLLPAFHVAEAVAPV